ncbi:MAG TPA: cyclase family protein [Steroidobacteraceae bacterium]
MRARIAVGDGEVSVDLARPLSLAIDLDFTSAQPRHFGAPAAQARPFTAPGFSGSVAAGAGCNCSIVSFVPHCNGTHTECVGHLTSEPLDAHRIVPRGLLPALLLTCQASDAAQSGETSRPAPKPGDVLISRALLQQGWLRWQDRLPATPLALIVRTLPNDADKRRRDYSQCNPAYFSSDAAEWLLARGIEHLVVDLPSIDRTHDEGQLTAHHVFFGLSAGARHAAAARRPAATITELAFVPDEVADGFYLLEIQVPALGGDAVPSRPMLYTVAVP